MRVMNLVGVGQPARNPKYAHVFPVYLQLRANWKLVAYCMVVTESDDSLVLSLTIGSSFRELVFTSWTRLRHLHLSSVTTVSLSSFSNDILAHFPLFSRCQNVICFCFWLLGRVSRGGEYASADELRAKKTFRAVSKSPHQKPFRKIPRESDAKKVLIHGQLRGRLKLLYFRCSSNSWHCSMYVVASVSTMPGWE